MSPSVHNPAAPAASDTDTPDPLVLTTGQSVPWPAAPLGWAQVVELRRTHVRLFYRCKSGRERQPVVPAADVVRLIRSAREPPLPIRNFYGRAAMGRSAEFPRARQGSRQQAAGREDGEGP